MRDIKFRCWEGKSMHYSSGQFDTLSSFFGHYHEQFYFDDEGPKDVQIMQFTGLKDKNGKDIYEGDILEFADKWEWYRGSYGIKMYAAEPDRKKKLEEQYNQEPMERREIKMPDCYEWILSSEIQTYWHVIGNIYENTELLK